MTSKCATCGHDKSNHYYIGKRMPCGMIECKCKKFIPLGCGKEFMNDEEFNIDGKGFAPRVKRVCGLGCVDKPYLCSACSEDDSNNSQDGIVSEPDVKLTSQTIEGRTDTEPSEYPEVRTSFSAEGSPKDDENEAEDFIGRMRIDSKKKDDESLITKEIIEFFKKVPKCYRCPNCTPNIIKYTEEQDRTFKQHLKAFEKEWRAKCKRMEIMSGNVAIYELNCLLDKHFGEKLRCSEVEG